MSDLRDRIQSDENAFQQLLASIPGFDGYREREIRRAADKLVREHLVIELDRVRDDLKLVVAAWARAGKLEVLDDIDHLARLLGKVRDNIRFADYGYTGFFDAIKIKEAELDRLYRYDLSLSQQIAGCATAVRDLAAAGEQAAADSMKAVEAAIAGLQLMVDRREEVAASVASPQAQETT